MRAVDIIRTKRDGGVLSAEQIAAFVQGVTSGAWPDYQATALLMAIVCRGMNATETAQLTAAMVRSGEVLDWSELGAIAVDKHSTGGVGDKTSLILAPLVAACGVPVPMMSGRGLGHTGGTLDKLEAIPGFRVRLSLPEMRTAMREVGCVLISPTAEIAPADRKLYALRDVTATVESIPLICASIMSKKLAEGIGGLVLDVKFGRGAFMQRIEDARALARALTDIGMANGVQTCALLTNMETPLGVAAGNALEVRESIEVLRGGGPADVRDLSLQLAAEMVRLGGVATTTEQGLNLVRQALDSGRGLEKFRQIIAHQGGDPRVIDDTSLLGTAPHRHTLTANRAGHVAGWDALRVGRACVLLGAGRDRAEDEVAAAAGAMVLVRPGDAVRAGDPLLELHYHDAQRLERALAELAGGCPILESPPAALPSLVLETL